MGCVGSQWDLRPTFARSNPETGRLLLEWECTRVGLALALQPLAASTCTPLWSKVIRDLGLRLEHSHEDEARLLHSYSNRSASFQLYFQVDKCPTWHEGNLQQGPDSNRR